MKHLVALTAASVLALGIAAQQPAEAFVSGGAAANASRTAQADVSMVEDVRRRGHGHRHHRHGHRHGHGGFWWGAAPLLAAPFFFGPSCDRYWSRRHGGWVERCW